MTDDAAHYTGLRIYFRKHKKVNHRAGEYVNPLDQSVHTNTIESYFSLFKRGMRGVISIAKSSTFTDTSRSLISGIITE